MMRLSWVIVGVWGCSDSGVKAINADPSAEITSHEDGDEVVEDETVTFRGAVSDADHVAADLTATWYLDDVLVCEEAAPEESGTTSCEVIIPDEAESIVLEVRDPKNATDSARVELVLVPTEAPVVEITAPMADSLTYSDQLQTLEGTASDNEDDAELLVVDWASSLDGDLDASTSPTSAGVFTSAAMLTEGTHLLTATATDTSGKTGSDSVTITVGPPNSAPTCTITAPETNSADEEGVLVTFEGLVDDVDVPVDWLAIAWSSDKDGELGTSTANTDGTVVFPYADLSINTHAITLQVTDEIGASCTASIIYSVGTPPTLELTSPTDAQVTDVGEIVNFAATIGDNEDVPTDLILSWVSDLDGEYSTQGSDSTGAIAFTVADFSIGTHTLTTTVTDTDGLYAQIVQTLQINAIPTAPEIRLTPDPATTTDDLLVTITTDSTDEDGDPIGYTYAWSVDGLASTASTSTTLSSTDTTKGETWTIEVTPTDGITLGPSATTSITISNTAPVLSDATLSPDPATESDTLLCTPGSSTDDDGDTVDYTYDWTVSGLSLGRDDDALTGDDFDKGDEISCTVIPNDGEEDGDAVTSNTVIIDNTVPSIDAVSISPDPAVATDTLVCSYTGYTDDDGDTDVSTFSWDVDGTTMGSEAELSGVFVGSNVATCTVTPNDGTVEGTAISASITIANTAPTLDGVTLTPDPAYENDTLICTPGTASDDDGESVSYAYTWSVDGVDPGESSDTLDGEFFDRDQTVFCTVTPSDGTESGDAVDSNSIIISNTAPTVTDVEIDPNPASVNDELNCSYTFDDEDDDTDASTVEWEVDGTVVGTDWSLDGGYAGGSVVTCTVTASDGTDEGSSSSDIIVIDNTVPVLVDVELSPDPAYEGDTLVCTPGEISDDDGTTSFGYAYRWTVDGTDPGETTDTLSSDFFDRDQDVVCYVTPNDGTDDGDEVESNTVIIENTAPSIDSVAITPDPATTTDALTCSYTGWEDADGDADSSSILWTINGSDSGTGASLSSGYVGGDSVSCTVTPDDGTDSGESISATQVITNTAPVLSSVGLAPTTAYEGDTLSCTPGTASDADGESVSYTTSWTVDGVDPGVSTDTLESAYFDRDQTVFCTVTPNDGSEDGEAVDSNTVTISNTAPTIDSLSLAPDPARAADTLSCSYTGYADADDDADSSTIDWTVDGVAAGSDATLVGVFVGGSVVECTVTPDDGTDTGTPLNASLTIDNTAPSIDSVAITPDPATVSDALLCSYTGYTDDDGDPDVSTIAWTINGSDAGSGDTLSTGYTGGDTVGCTVTPDDGADTGTPLSTSIVITNTPPELASVALTPTTATETDTLTCSPATATDADGDTVSYAYTWSVDGSDPGVGTDTLDGAYFDRDQDVYCTVVPLDDDESGDPVDSNTVTISNTAPTLDTVSITPNDPIASDTLICSYTGYADDDDDADQSTFAWTVDGSSAGSDAELSGSFDAGSEVVCTVTPDDGTDTGTALSSTVTIHTPPEISSVGLTPTTATETDTLTCTPSTPTDVDGDTVSTDFRWSVDGADPGVSTDTLDGAYFDRDQDVYCSVTPSDDYETGDTVDSNTVRIENTAPSIDGVSISPTTALASDTLSCTYTGYADVDDDADVSTLQWTVDGIDMGTDPELSSAFEGGDEVVCTVTPNDGTDTGTARSASLTIDNTPPVLTEVTLGPDPAYEADTLTCTPGTTEDDDGTTSFTYAYTWTVDGSTISTTTSTLTGDDFDKDQAITCTVTPNDGTEDGEAVESNEIVVENSIPVVSDLSIDPDPAYAEDTLLCSWTYEDDDGDGDYSSVEWTINGTTAGIDPTLTGGFVYGDEVVCAVTPIDRVESGTVEEIGLTISNTAPVLSEVSINPDSAYEIDTLTCVPGETTDADGTESFYYEYAWYVNGSDTGVTNANIDGTYFDRDDDVICIAWPHDGDDLGSPMASDALTISNSPPTLDFAAIVPTAPTIDDVLVCNYGGYIDDDGDPEAGTYISWQINGIDAGTGGTLSSGFFVGDLVTCTVYASDGSAYGDGVSDEVTIVNQLPEVASVSLSPGTAYTDDTLTVSASGVDPDGDSVTLSYAWYVDGSVIAETGTTLDGSTYFEKDQEVYVVVTPNDGTDDGVPEASSTLTISNTAPVLDGSSITPETAYEGDTLTCNLGNTTDADGDTSFSYSYGWMVSGLATSVTTNTLDSSYFGRGDTILCSATPSDGEDTGSAATSDTIEISNSEPEVTTVTLSPATVYTDDTITATATTSDEDSDAVSLTYAWYVDGSLVTETGATLSGSSYFDKDEEVYVVVTPSDGTEQGEPMTSDSLTVSNTAPGAPTVSIEPDDPIAEVDDIICTVDSDSSDDDGDSISYTVTWEVDGVAYTDATTTHETGDTVPSGDLAGDEEWTCTVTPNDGDEDGSTASASTTIGTCFDGWDDTENVEDADYMLLGEADRDFAGYLTKTAGDVDGDGLADLLVSAYGNDDGGTDAGKIYLFFAANLGGTDTLNLDEADYTFIGEDAGDRAGLGGLGTAGDVDGDGQDDILIGSYDNDDGGVDAGRAYLVLAASLDVDTEIELGDSDYVFTGEGASYYVGQVVAAAGDVDGDGLGDFLIGAFGVNSAYLFLGSSLGSTTEFDISEADYIFVGEDSGDRAGIMVASAGDVDDDGYDDILIGADKNDGSGTNAGRSYLIFGSSLGSDSSIDLADADYTFDGENGSDQSGQTLDGAGDVDGDGLSDILIGAQGHGSSAGRVYLVLGASLGSSSSIDLSDADYTFDGEEANDYAGIGLAGAGDVDGDGLSDILIGATHNDDGGDAAGKAYLIFGSSLGSDSAIDLSNANVHFIGENDYEKTGGAVEGAGDIDGDGLDDILISAFQNDDTATDAGKIYVWLAPTTCNTPPRGTDIAIDPSDPVEAVDDLVCEIDDDAYDAEGDSISYTIEWEVDGVSYTDATTTTETGDTVPAEDLFADEEWVCIVTPNDGTEDGAPTETSVTIENDPCLGGDVFDDGVDDDGDGLDCASECATSGAYFTVCAEEYLTWSEAEDTCLDAGYDGLASVLSAAEQSLVEDLMIDAVASFAWIGLNDIDTEGTYEWSDGSTLSYTNWHPGEPSGGSEDCTLSQSNIGYEWNDGTCSLTTIEGFVCVSR